MLELVAYGRFLHNATQSPETFDFSLAYAIVGWIRTIISGLQEDSPIISEVVNGINALDSVISMTSGKGLSDIWRALSSGVSHVGGSKLKGLDTADRRLRRSPDYLSMSYLQMYCASMRSNYLCIQSAELRIQILELMSMWCLPKTISEDQKHLLVRMTAQVDSVRIIAVLSYTKRLLMMSMPRSVLRREVWRKTAPINVSVSAFPSRNSPRSTLPSMTNCTPMQ